MTKSEFIEMTIPVIVGTTIGYAISYFIFRNFEESEKIQQSENKTEQLPKTYSKRTDTSSRTICGYIVMQTKDTLYVLYPSE